MYSVIPKRMKKMESQVKLIQAEAIRIRLSPGDVLAVTIKSDDLDRSTMQQLRDQIAQVFPENKVLILGVGENGDVTFKSIEKVESGCSTENYCSDCDCGKKAVAESKPTFKVGTKVVFVSNSQNEADTIEGESFLRFGEIYTVKQYNPGVFRNEILLEGFEALHFNADMFREIK